MKKKEVIIDITEVRISVESLVKLFPSYILPVEIIEPFLTAVRVIITFASITIPPANNYLGLWADIRTENRIFAMF